MCVYVYLSNQVITIVFAIKDNQSYLVRLYILLTISLLQPHVWNIVYLDVDNVPTMTQFTSDRRPLVVFVYI